MVKSLISKGIAFPAYILLCIAFYAIAIMDGFPTPLEGKMLFYNIIVAPLENYNWFNIAISALLITSVALIASSFINKYYLTGLRTHLPLFLNFMLFTAGGLFIQVTPGLMAIPIVLFSLNSIFESFDKDNAVFEANSSAIGISIAFILYLPFLYLIPVLIIAIAINKQLRFKNFLALLTGTVVLPIILAGLFFYYNNWEAYITPFQFHPASNALNIPKGYWIFLGTISIWTIIAYILFARQAPLKKIRPRKIYNIINVLGIASIIAMATGYSSVINTAPVLIIMILFLINHMYPLLNRRIKMVFLTSIIATYLFSFVNTL